MEKIVFTDAQSGESAEFFVVEETRFHGFNYLLVTDSEDDEAEAFILKDISGENEEEANYVFVEDENEMGAVAAIFDEMLEDIDLK